MGKCKFAESWLEHEQLEPWLKPVAGNDRESHCSVCKEEMSVASMGGGASLIKGTKCSTHDRYTTQYTTAPSNRSSPKRTPDPKRRKD